MGQSNCQCQLPRIDEQQSSFRKKHNRADSSKLNFIVSPRLISQQHIRFANPVDMHLCFIEESSNNKLYETTLNRNGTTVLCNASKNGIKATDQQFTLQIVFKNRNVYFRDEGVGYGTFVLRRKITQVADGSQILMQVDGVFVMLHLRRSELIYTVYLQGRIEGRLLKADLQEQSEMPNEISWGTSNSIFVSSKGDNSYLIRLKRNGNLWLYLNQDTKVKAGDIIRLGSQRCILAMSRNDKD